MGKPGKSGVPGKDAHGQLGNGENGKAAAVVAAAAASVAAAVVMDGGGARRTAGKPAEGGAQTRRHMLWERTVVIIG